MASRLIAGGALFVGQGNSTMHWNAPWFPYFADRHQKLLILYFYVLLSHLTANTLMVIIILSYDPLCSV